MGTHLWMKRRTKNFSLLYHSIFIFYNNICLLLFHVVCFYLLFALFIIIRYGSLSSLDFILLYVCLHGKNLILSGESRLFWYGNILVGITSIDRKNKNHSKRTLLRRSCNCQGYRKWRLFSTRKWRAYVV